ncbi:MAG TPA: aminotransferase class V-fold PLP-dependent enzyme [Gemmatimonadaceae bacterium]|nr:aminotransferase class V-fold PLP-dependent enzyme [Gemmatimonadaceae bacterium]
MTTIRKQSRNAGRVSAERARTLFPILTRRVNRRRIVYLDSAATSQRPEPVLDAMASYYRTTNANTRQEGHALGKTSKRISEQSRARVANYVGATSDQLVWVKGATEGINLVARSWGDRHVGAGDNIVVSVTEHFANLVPWQELAKRMGAELRVANVDAEGRIRLDELQKLVTRRTRIVAITHVSNVLGMINPVEAIVEIAGSKGARVLIDGAQSAPHLKINLSELGCDFFVFSAHKLGGPFGEGALWASSDMLDQMDPIEWGGGTVEEATTHRAKFAPPPKSFEPGTGNPAGASGFRAAVELIQRVGERQIWEYEQQLVARGLEVLGSIPDLTLLGSKEVWERVPIFSFSYKDLDGELLASRLGDRGIAVSGGNLNAQPALKRFGLESACRASCWLYNTVDEIEQLGEALVSIRR